MVPPCSRSPRRGAQERAPFLCWRRSFPILGGPYRSVPSPVSVFGGPQWTARGRSGASGRPAAPSAPTGAAASALPRPPATAARTAAACCSTPKTAPMGSACTVSAWGGRGDRGQWPRGDGGPERMVALFILLLWSPWCAGRRRQFWLQQGCWPSEKGDGLGGEDQRVKRAKKKLKSWVEGLQGGGVEGCLSFPCPRRCSAPS